MSTEFWQYELLTKWKDDRGSHDELLCIGERIKKGTFRPCLTEAIPFSSIVGALRERLGIDYDTELIAAGYIEHLDKKEPEVGYTVLAPHDAALGTAKPPAPLTIQWLRQVTGRIFIEVDNERVKKGLEAAGSKFEIRIGAMKAAGFGRCLLRKVGEERPTEKVRGTLLTRIPDKHKDRFGIEVHKPRYGYLFEPSPSDDSTGIYVKSLYEGSDVEGYSFLVKERDAEGGDR